MDDSTLSAGKGAGKGGLQTARREASAEQQRPRAELTP